MVYATKEKYNAYMRQYMGEKILCECGKTISKKYKNKHILTEKHILIIENKKLKKIS
jgi:hypothetical protein